MLAPSPAMGRTAWPSCCLAPQLGPFWTFFRTDLQTMLAIADWEKGASWRAQGWAGEIATATTGPCTPHESQRVRHPASRRARKTNELGKSQTGHRLRHR